MARLREDFLRVELLRALWLGPPVSWYPLFKQPSEKLVRHIGTIIGLIRAASVAFIVVVVFLREGYQSHSIHGIIPMVVGVGAVTLWPPRHSLDLRGCHLNGTLNAFVTVGKDSEGGKNAGLGLFVAKAIAEARGGQITASDLHKPPSVRFEVCLPIEMKHHGS